MVGICVLEMHILEANSLKDKRKIIKSITQRIRQRFNASVHENNYHDNWHKAELEIAVAAQNRSSAEKVLQEIIKFAEIDGRAEIVRQEIDYV